MGATCCKANKGEGSELSLNSKQDPLPIDPVSEFGSGPRKSSQDKGDEFTKNAQCIVEEAKVFRENYLIQPADLQIDDYQYEEQTEYVARILKDKEMLESGAIYYGYW